MNVSIIETTGLGDRSYMVSEGDVAVVIDPQRDIDRVFKLAAELGVRITHVLETHTHNDYVTGGLELSRVARAEYVVPAGDHVDYQRRAISDGDIIDSGPFQLEAVHTPGHTHHHVSYALRNTTGTIVGVFTGGSMLHGTTGRTDLLGDEHTLALTHAQFHSVRRLAAELPDDAQVYPTHGFGSFCSATPSSGNSSTIADQRLNNPALTQDEQSYVEELIAGLSAYPSYYAHMGVINERDPPPSICRCRNWSIRTNCAGVSRPASGSWTFATAPPSRPGTSTAPLVSSCRTPSSPTSGGCTPGVPH